jgi:hypothetical protein
METIRVNLVNLLNDLQKLLDLTTNSGMREKLRTHKRICFILLEEVVRQEIDSSTKEFSEAISSLKDAQKAVEVAKADNKKVADAINRIALAAKAVDQIVKVGTTLLA